MHQRTPPPRIVAMNAPATLLRQPDCAGDEAVTVARGPFVILAHGLLSIPPDKRDRFWIATQEGDIGPDEAEALLRAWMNPATAA